MKFFASIILSLFLLTNTWAQNYPNLNNQWQHLPEQDAQGNAPYTKQIQLNEDGTFFDAGNQGGGNYQIQGKALTLHYQFPKVIQRNFQIQSNTATKLVLSTNKTSITYISPSHPKFIKKQMANGKIKPPQGFNFSNLLRGVLGIAVLLGIAFVFSSNRKKIHWKTIAAGLCLQVVLAILILKGDTFGFGFFKGVFKAGGKFFTKVLDFTKSGSEFLLSGLVDVESYGFIFLFQVLPILIFFSALTSVLFYLGIIQKIVRALAWAMAKIMKVSGAEALSVAGNIFLGQTESPLMIKEYLPKMNRSEILLVMIGGMATVAGSVLGAYIGFLGGDDPAAQQYYATHLLAASVMAAPGAIVVSKILLPNTDAIEKSVQSKVENTAANFLDALSNGTTEGLKLAANVGAMLLVFIAFIAMLNSGLSWLGDVTNLNQWIAVQTKQQYNSLSLELILGYIFAPLMWLIGVPNNDLNLMGQLLGIKLAASEFVAYINLADIKNPNNILHLNNQKSIIMATYMLCGFANFASIGIQIGGIGMLAPSKKVWLSELGMKALLGGTIASLISATIAGMLIG